MDLGYRTDLEQYHGLYLTTELAQGISVLQMNAADLAEYVRECVDENPFFEDDCVEPAHDPVPDRYRGTMSADELLEQRGHGSPERFGNERPDMSQRDFSFDRFLIENNSLEDYLVEQLHMQIDDERDRAVGEYLIGCIDESGYMRMPLLCVSAALGVSEEEALRVLGLIQHIEPVGIGARNLAECLRLQLENEGLMTDVLQDLLDNHLQKFSSRTPAAIARSMGVPLAELVEALDAIRTCNPRPGAQFGGASCPIWPEVVVEAAGEGCYRVRLQISICPLCASTSSIARS